MDRDLLDDGPCSCGRANCPCGRCHGTRWIEVQAGYVDRLAPDPDTLDLAAMTDDQRAHALAVARSRRAGAADSVYPCKACAPTQFYRWAGGHLAPGHDATDCAECIDLYGKKTLRRHAAEYQPRERKDIDG